MFDLKTINWAFVLVILLTVVGAVLIVNQVTYSETVTGADDKGVAFTRNINKIGMGKPEKPKTA